MVAVAIPPDQLAFETLELVAYLVSTGELLKQLAAGLLLE
jgi:hypothetical protein